MRTLTDRVRFDEENELRVIARNSGSAQQPLVFRRGHLPPGRAVDGGPAAAYPALNGVRRSARCPSTPRTVEVTVQHRRRGGACRWMCHCWAISRPWPSAAGGHPTGEAALTRALIPNAKAVEPWSHPEPLHAAASAFGERRATCRRHSVSAPFRGAKRAFLLNGERVIVQGACIHHDHGVLGALLLCRRREERQVRLLQGKRATTPSAARTIPARRHCWMRATASVCW